MVPLTVDPAAWDASSERTVKRNRRDRRGRPRNGRPSGSHEAATPKAALRPRLRGAAGKPYRLSYTLVLPARSKAMTS